MGRLGVVAGGGRGWKAIAAPAAFLLVATVAVVVFRSTRHAQEPSSPSPRVVVTHPAAQAPRAYTVKAGDTVVSIAAKTGVPAGRLAALNPGLHPTSLFIGQKIRLR
jgi:LysM repeat protein